MSLLPQSISKRLVDDYRQALKWWSVRWAALGAIVLPALNVVPASLPPEIQALFPPSVRAIVTGLWMIGFLLLRLWAQRHPNG
jgi:hypothetical protein